VDELGKLVHLIMRGIRNGEPWCALVAADLNTSVGLFLKDLLSVMDRGAVLGMVPVCAVVRVRVRWCVCGRSDGHGQVDDYVAKICPANDSAVLVKFKFNILKIVCDHEHYVPLNVPVSPGIVSVPAIPAQFWYFLINIQNAYLQFQFLIHFFFFFFVLTLFVYRKSHFLAGLVIHEITACLHRDKLIRSEVPRHRPLQGYSKAQNFMRNN
jgi:hypothetical protein